jgi:hypothetical protein
MLKEISYDLIGHKHDQSIKEMQLAEDVKLFAILFGFPPINSISPRTNNYNDDPPITHRHNIWLRKYYLRKFKERMNQLCH